VKKGGGYREFLCEERRRIREVFCEERRRIQRDSL
jgi:hypothetical protein